MTTDASELGGTKHGAAAASASTEYGGWAMDAVVAILSVFFFAGVTLDFRSHHSGISFAEEGFFTPEHMFFYTMFLGIAAVVGSVTYRNRRTGADWVEAVPSGYGWGIVGLLLFGLGGVGDFWWHTTFGFEHGTEGLTSPSHLMLATGTALLLASPLRAAWYRSDDPTGVEIFPVIVSASLLFSLLVLFGGWANPISQPQPAPTISNHAAIMIGISGLHLFSLFFVGGMQALIRQFQLPFGALTVMIGVPAVVTAVVWGTFDYIVTVVLTGLTADAFVRWRRPTPTNLRALRMFGALIPLVFVGSYMGIIRLTDEIAWTVHVWTGAVITAGLAGLLLTYAIAPSLPKQE